MREVTQYEADDGTLHPSEEECVAYELEQKDINRVAAYGSWLANTSSLSGKARTSRMNVVLMFLAWEREQGGGAEAAE